MTSPDRITQLAQQPPVRSLSTRLGELKETADTQIANLASTLKQIDETSALLNQHGLQTVVDLGEIGNAAAQARRQVLSVKKTFVAPQHRTAA